MNTKKKTLTGAVKRTTVILSIVMIAFMTMSCEKPINSDVKEENPLQKTTLPTYYIVGYDVCSGIVVLEDGTCKAKGYLIVSENLRDTLVAYNMPDSLFVFPKEIMPQNVFGFNFFPQQCRFDYPFQMSYQEASDSQKLFFPCTTLYAQLYNIEPKQVIAISTLKL